MSAGTTPVLEIQKPAAWVAIFTVFKRGYPSVK